MASPAMIIRIAANLEEFKKNLKEGQDQIKLTTAGIAKIADALQGDKLIQRAQNVAVAIKSIGGASKLTAAEAARHNATITRALEKYKALGKEAPQALKDLQAQLSAAATRTKSFGERLESVKAKAIEVGKVLLKVGAAAAAAMGAALALMVRAASQFEDSFAGVRKTVEATEPQFAALAAGFRKMATEIPVSVNELNRIGEAAGQLGVRTSDLLSFTRTMADLGVTTNLSSEQAATGFARFANIIDNEAGPQFDRIGSTIVELGNNLATTEAEILDFGLRIAGSGKLAGLAEAEILAIGAAMSSIGVNAESGGTSVQKVLNAMNQAVATSSKELQIFARTAGLSSAEFARTFREDAATAFQQFVEGLGRQGEAAFATLEGLSLGNERVIRAFLGLAGAGDLLAKSLEIGRRGWEENIALAVEAQKRYETFSSQVVILKNVINDLAIAGGQLLLPVLTLMVGNLSSLGTQTQKTSTAISTMSSIFVTAIRVVDLIQTGFRALQVVSNTVFIAIKTLAKGMVDLAISIAEAGSRVPILGRAFQTTGSGMEQMRRESDRLAAEIDGLGQASEDAVSSSIELGNTLSAVEAEIKANTVAAKAGADMSVLQAAATTQLSVASEQTAGMMETLRANTQSVIEPLSGITLKTHDYRQELEELIRTQPFAIDQFQALAQRIPLASTAIGVLDGTIISSLPSVKGLGDALKNVNDTAEETPGLLERIFGTLQDVFGSLNDIFQRAFEGGGGIGGAIKSFATKAVAEFAKFIPVVGEIVSQFAGAIVAGFSKFMSLFGGDPVFKQAMNDIGRTWGVQISEGLAKQIEADATKIGDRVAAQLLNLSAVMKEVGGVMAFGFVNATKRANDLFSMIETGKLTLDQVRPVFLDVFRQLATNFEIAGASGQQAFAILTQTAKNFGITVAELGPIFRDVLGEMAQRVTDPKVMDSFRSLLQVAREFGIALTDLQAPIETAFRTLGQDLNANAEAFKALVKDALALGFTIKDLEPIFVDMANALDLATKSGREGFLLLFQTIAQGGGDVSSLMAQLSSFIGGMVSQVTQAGGIVSAQFTEMITRAKELGLATAEIAAFFEANWTKAIDGMTAALSSGFEFSRGTIAAFGASAVAIFGQMVQAGIPILDILKRMQPLWAQLRQQMIDAGLKGTAAFRELNRWMRIFNDKALQPAIQAALSLGQVIEGLANIGALTQKQFNSFGRDLVKVFDDLVAGGAKSRQALILMQPTLQSLWEAQEKFGFKTDAATQKLLDQALAAGIIGPKFKSAGDLMLQAMQGVIDILIAIGKQLAILTGTEFVIPVTVDVDDSQLSKLPGGGVPGDIKIAREQPKSSGARRFGSGGVVTEPTFALLGEEGPEAVVPLDRAISTRDPLNNDIAVGDRVDVNITINAVDATGFDRVVDDELIPRLVRALEVNRRHVRTNVKAALGS